MLQLTKYFTLIIFASLLFTSCGDDEPEIENEEEVITTLTYTLVSGGNTVTLSFQDLDGDGAAAPTITSGVLTANTTYTGSIELLNETESPAEDITEEIEEEDEEHQFFFDSNVATVSYDDQDADGNPIGLSTTLTTGDAASGTLTVTLRHEPNKSADGVADGNIANAGGETDIEVTFNVDVQ